MEPELLQTFQGTCSSLLGARFSVVLSIGSVARSREHAMSDVDVMVIGRAGLADLSPALRKVEEHLGREVNVTAVTEEEERTRSGHCLDRANPHAQK